MDNKTKQILGLGMGLIAFVITSLLLGLSTGVIGLISFALFFIGTIIIICLTGLTLSILAFIKNKKMNSPIFIGVLANVISILSLAFLFVTVNDYANQTKSFFGGVGVYDFNEEESDYFGDENINDQPSNIDWEAEMDDAYNDTQDEESK